LFGLEPAEVTGPLAVFQATRFTEEDFKGLVETINNADADSKLDKSVLENVFEMWWPRLKEQADKILAEHTPAETGEPRKERDILEEILELTRLHVRQGKPRGFYTRQYTKYMDAFKEGMPLVLYDPELSGNVVVKWLPPVPEVPGDVSPSGSPEPDYSGPDLGNQED
jgi:superfamily I DNA and/or RNA helicase